MYPYQATSPYSPQLAQHQADNQSYHQNQHQQNHHQSSRQLQQQGDGHTSGGGGDPYRRVSVPGFNNLPAMLQQSLIGTPPASAGGYDFHAGSTGQGMNAGSGMSRYPMQGNGSHHLGDDMNGGNGSSMGDYSHLGAQMNQHHGHASGTSTPANNLGGGGAGSGAASPMMMPISSSSSVASRNRQHSSVFQDEMAIMKRKRGSIDQDDLNVHLRQHHQRSGGATGNAGTGGYSPFPFTGHGMQDTGFGAHRFPSGAASTTGTSSLPISRRGSGGHITTTNTTESSPTHTRDVSPYQTSSSPHHQGYGQYGQNQQRQPQQGGGQSNGLPTHPHASAPSSTSSSLTKKPRLIKACEPCRLRKIGCDGTHPVCQRCRADDRVGECRFIKTIVRSSLTRKRMTELEDRLERWERIWNGFLGGDAGSAKNGHQEDEIEEDEEMPVGEVDVDVIERSLRDKGERGRAMRGKIVERLGGTLLPGKGSRDGRSGRNAADMMNGFAVQPIKQEPMGLPNYLAAVPPPPPSIPVMHAASSHPLPINGLGLESGSMPVPTSQLPNSTISRPLEWNQTTAQIDKSLDGTGSFTRSGGSGSTYLGLSSGVTFLNAILKLCKERGGIFIDVENAIPSTVPGLTMGGNVVDAATVDVVKQITAPSTGKEKRSGVSSGWNDQATVNDPEVIKKARTLPSKEEYGPLVDSYFAYFHGITPMVHEPTIRSILNGEKPFPQDDSFLALLYMIFAMGALDSVRQESDDHGQKYCDTARAILNSDIMESGSMELVQTIAILANYLQRNDKPNAGYLCLGAAVRMAIGIGLHVHDNDDKLSPLEAEMRKRVWWSVSVLESGCSKTFGRPSGLCGINLFQIPLVSNIDDDLLTPNTKTQPLSLGQETLYSTLIGHSKLARATTIVHTSILQLQPAPSLEQIKQYDRMILQVIGDLPSYITYPTGPVAFGFSRYVLIWRLRDWRAILYRPILLAAAWDQVKEKHLSPAIVDAISICRSLATENLGEMADYFRTAQLRGANRAEEWYCMYFAHQSSLTLLLSLVGEPAHVEAESWRQTILATATWFRQLQAMKTAGTALASILENVVFATASIPIRDQTSITPTDNWLLNKNKQGGQAVVPNDALDVMRYWNALCPEGANGPVWDDSIWNAMMSMNPETLA